MSVKKLSSKERKEALRNKMRNDAKNKDTGGGGSKRLLDLSAYPDMTFFKPKIGTNIIAILPFIIQTDRFVKVKDNSEPGQEEYVLDIWAHTFIGPGQDSFVCLAKTFGKPCPICEDIADMQKAGTIEKETLDKIKAKRRVIYNVLDMNDEEKGIQLFEVSHYLFAHELLEEAETGEEFAAFADLAEGISVKFRCSETQYKGRKGYKFKNFSFIKGDPFDEEVLEQTYPLDKMLRVLTYEEMKNAYYGIDDGSDDEEAADESAVTHTTTSTGKRTIANRPGRRQVEKEDEPEPEEDDEKPAAKKAPVRKKAAEPEEDDEPEEEEQPKKKVLTRKPKDVVPEEEEEADEPEEDEKPAKKTSSKTKCPSGHKFGVDCDTKDECPTCDEWEACAEEHDSK